MSKTRAGGRRSVLCCTAIIALLLCRVEAAQSQSYEPDMLSIIEGLRFSNGTIEAEIAGTPGPGALQGARGFVGIAFRVSDDGATYDAFYLRPTNGRADDQERRNHAAQYISHPTWTWNRLRQETPSRYEAYVDLLPNEWTSVVSSILPVRKPLPNGLNGTKPMPTSGDRWAGRDDGFR